MRSDVDLIPVETRMRLAQEALAEFAVSAVKTAGLDAALGLSPEAAAAQLLWSASLHQRQVNERALRGRQ